MKPLITLLLSVSLFAATPGETPLTGTFALQGATVQTAGHLIAAPIAGDPLDRHLDVWMTRAGSGETIRAYAVDMTKYLHMIVVSDDFRVFLHVHPVLQANGHFILDQRVPRAGRYHIYADAQPEGIGQQVFRFDLNIGDVRGTSSRDLSERATTTTAGPYTVSLSTRHLVAGGESHITIHILKDGKPAGDLHPYLGALAHAVFLNASDLSYVHAHPMRLGAMDGGTMHMSMDMPPLPDAAISSPDMQLHVALREPGTYKLWLQFRGGKTLYVAPFVLTAEPR